MQGQYLHHTDERRIFGCATIFRNLFATVLMFKNIKDYSYELKKDGFGVK